jgi:8-oxo-dGTP diphosphatase
MVKTGNRRKIMGRTEKCELTMLCLLRRGDEVLLQNRVKKDWSGYTLPGGHVEPGESFVDACIREMKEETGLDISDVRLCGLKQFPDGDSRYIVFLFTAESFSGELRSSAEGKMEWVDIRKLEEYNTVSDLRELLDVMLKPELNEFQYIVRGDDWIVNLR